MATEDMIEPLKPTFKTSYAILFGITVIIAPFLLIGALWVANAVLPPNDADAFKAPLFAAWGAIATISGSATVAGGLLKTWGKVKSQINQSTGSVLTSVVSNAIENNDSVPSNSLPMTSADDAQYLQQQAVQQQEAEIAALDALEVNDANL